MITTGIINKLDTFITDHMNKRIERNDKPVTIYTLGWLVKNATFFQNESTPTTSPHQLAQQMITALVTDNPKFIVTTTENFRPTVELA